MSSNVVTPNSVQARLNQVQNPLFIETGIQDPIVKQNFEVLNKALQKRLQGIDVPKSNIVFSPAIATLGIPFSYTGTTTIFTPGTLQVQITTRGNPVKIKLAPFLAADASYLSLSGTTQNAVTMTSGWKRIEDDGTNTTICQSVVGLDAELPGGIFFTNLQKYIQLPAFEFEDVVPTGTYTYQFFFQLEQATTFLEGLNLNCVAQELR